MKPESDRTLFEESERLQRRGVSVHCKKHKRNVSWKGPGGKNGVEVLSRGQLGILRLKRSMAPFILLTLRRGRGRRLRDDY